jgi:uncharacterized protein (TIGR03000 family)
MGCYGGCYGGSYAVPVTGGGATGGEMRREGGSSDKGGKKSKGPEEEMGSLYGPAPATLVVSVPADARLTVDGTLTKTTSSLRRFTTPPLERGRLYYYNLAAEVQVDGRLETITQRVTVRAGEETRAALSAPVATASAR